MCKKLLIAALAVVVGVGVVSSTRLGSHIRLWWNKGSNWAKQQVPPETEIERLRMELSRLSSLDERYYDQVARQKRDVRKLREKLSKDKTSLTKLEREIKSMRTALLDETEKVVVDLGNGRTEYSRENVLAQIREDAQRFFTDAEAVKADDEHLRELEKTLAINEQKLKDLELTRKKMAVRLVQLEKELAQERRLQTQSEMTLDDSQYAKVNKEIEELEGRIESMKIKRDLRGQSTRGPIRAQEEAKEADRKLDRQIDDYFGKSEIKKVTSSN